jgi:gamma-glutamyltranspeptidase
VPGYGFALHNRGGLFTLDPAHPNAIAPHKRPFNTLSAGFVMKDGRPLMAVTLMGGAMQAGSDHRKDGQAWATDGVGAKICGVANAARRRARNR